MMSNTPLTARDLGKAAVAHQEAWLHALGIKTEYDAQMVAQDWKIEHGMVNIVETDDGNLRATTTERLVPRHPR